MNYKFYLLVPDSPVDRTLHISNKLRISHGFLRIVSKLTCRKTIAFLDFHDDVQRGDAAVVGKPGADSKRNLAAACEMLLDFRRAFKIQCIRKQKCLSQRINPKLLVVSDDVLTPLNRIS